MSIRLVYCVYCLCLDLTADKTSAQPPIQMFTLKDGDFITSKYPGVGGLDGLSSGAVSYTHLDVYKRQRLYYR